MSKTVSMRAALEIIMEYVAKMVMLLDEGEAAALKVVQAAKALAIIASRKLGL